MRSSIEPLPIDEIWIKNERIMIFQKLPGETVSSAVLLYVLESICFRIRKISNQIKVPFPEPMEHSNRTESSFD